MNGTKLSAMFLMAAAAQLVGCAVEDDPTTQQEEQDLTELEMPEAVARESGRTAAAREDIGGIAEPGAGQWGSADQLGFDELGGHWTSGSTDELDGGFHRLGEEDLAVLRYSAKTSARCRVIMDLQGDDQETEVHLVHNGEPIASFAMTDLSETHSVAVEIEAGDDIDIVMGPVRTWYYATAPVSASMACDWL